jgi:peptidoglycan/xylan/chitin deacetylase (PgdA/CDA1 family)
MTPARLLALGSLVTAVLITAVIVLTSGGGSGQHAAGDLVKPATLSRRHRASGASATRLTGQAAVPILAYHVINQAPPGSPISSSSLYVPTSEFSAQMQALRAAGWHAITLDQLEANWTRGAALGPGKPLVLTFDDGYASHFTNALPILKRYGWVGVENLQLSGLAPADGGLSDSQVRGLIAAGWELDSEAGGQSDLTSLDPLTLSEQVTTARQTLRSRYNVPANWFCYPGGHYNGTVIAAARAVGFVGATTTFAGWAGPQSARFRLPRIEVRAGTTPSQLLTQIASAKQTVSATPTSQ